MRLPRAREEICIEGKDDIGLLQAIEGFDLGVKSHPGPCSHEVPPDRVVRVPSRTRQLAHEHCSAALWSLAALPPNEGVQRLANLALTLLERNR